ncbi:MAG: hypothetical protein U9N14_07400 [Pseudomonadota bacterium]|nr:hypothetical protein [Pseudomonadota bacterium]
MSVRGIVFALLTIVTLWAAPVLFGIHAPGSWRFEFILLWSDFSDHVWIAWPVLYFAVPLWICRDAGRRKIAPSTRDLFVFVNLVLPGIGLAWYLAKRAGSVDISSRTIDLFVLLLVLWGVWHVFSALCDSAAILVFPTLWRRYLADVAVTKLDYFIVPTFVWIMGRGTLILVRRIFIK